MCISVVFWGQCSFLIMQIAIYSKCINSVWNDLFLFNKFYFQMWLHLFQLSCSFNFGGVWELAYPTFTGDITLQDLAFSFHFLFAFTLEKMQWGSNVERRDGADRRSEDSTSDIICFVVLHQVSSASAVTNLTGF